MAKAKIGVLGASGYTGSELVRLLLRHPHAEIALLTADRRAGQEMAAVFPQFAPYVLPKLVSIDAVDWVDAGLDAIFCALPHATTQKVIKQIFEQEKYDIILQEVIFAGPRVDITKKVIDALNAGK